jgi:hypothetical protein
MVIQVFMHLGRTAGQLLEGTSEGTTTELDAGETAVLLSEAGRLV